MALRFIPRVVERVSTNERTPEDQNDFLLTVKLPKGSASLKDVFKLSDAKFEKYINAGTAMSLIADDETQKVYLAVVPDEKGEVLKFRTGFNKTAEFQYKQLVDLLVAFGQVPADRVEKNYFAFNLIETPEAVADVASIKLDDGSTPFEGVSAVLELQKTEVIGRAASYASNVEKKAKEPVTSTEGDAAVEEGTSVIDQTTVPAAPETEAWED